MDDDELPSQHFRDSQHSTTEYLVEDRRENHFFEDGNDRSRNEAIQRQIQHSNVGYDDQSYIIVDDDRKRWNLPKVPIGSESNGMHTTSTIHHQARSGFIDSTVEDDESRIVSVINQPPLQHHKEFRQASTFKQSSNFSGDNKETSQGSRVLSVINQPPLQNKDFQQVSSSQNKKISRSDHFHQEEYDDEDFLEEDESRVISVLSEHPQEQEKVKWQTISDAPDPISTSVTNTKQRNDQPKVVMENEVIQANEQEVFQEFYDLTTSQRKDIKDIPYPSDYAVVQKKRFRRNNLQNEETQYNNEIREKRSITRNDPIRTTTTTTTMTRRYELSPEDDRKISQFSNSTTTTTTSRKVSQQQQQPVRIEHQKTSRQESYKSVGEQERRVRKKPVIDNLQTIRQESHINAGEQERRTVQKQSSAIEQELKDWMNLQRKETDRNRYKINGSIGTQNVLEDGKERMDLRSAPRRRSRVDTLKVIPENDNVVTGQNIPDSYYIDDDATTDNVTLPKTAALQSSNDSTRNEPYFAEDFIDQTDGASKNKGEEKKESLGFFGRLKNKLFSSPDTKYKDDDDEYHDSDEDERCWGK